MYYNPKLMHHCRGRESFEASYTHRKVNRLKQTEEHVEF